MPNPADATDSQREKRHPERNLGRLVHGAGIGRNDRYMKPNKIKNMRNVRKSYISVGHAKEFTKRYRNLLTF